MPTILLIDDNYDEAVLIHRVLGERLRRFLHAENGWEGVIMARQKTPDVIIIDLVMPGMDGFSVVHELKNHPDTRGIPVVFTSARELTREERKQLHHVELICQKGTLKPREFANRVIKVIEGKYP